MFSKLLRRTGEEVKKGWLVATHSHSTGWLSAAVCTTSLPGIDWSVTSSSPCTSAAATTTSIRCYSSSSVEKQNNTAEEPTFDELRKATVMPQVLKKYIPSHDVLHQDDCFKLGDLVSIEELFSARVHLGHKVGTLNQDMKWALYGERLGVCVFDLDVTKACLMSALQFAAHLAYKSGVILFVSSDRENAQLVERVAVTAGEYAHVRKWMHGTFTNSVKNFGQEIRLPDCVIFANTQSANMERHPAIIEAAKLAIPTVAIVDSNCSPHLITYPIPGNDDTPESVAHVITLFGKAILRGKKVARSTSAQK